MGATACCGEVVQSTLTLGIPSRNRAQLKMIPEIQTKKNRAAKARLVRVWRSDDAFFLIPGLAFAFIEQQSCFAFGIDIHRNTAAPCQFAE